jgi:putative ABC transport system permease protein
MGIPVFFVQLIFENVYTRKMRTVLTGLTIAVTIMTVVAMGILTHSLRQTAISILQTGKADFSIAEKNVSDVLNSSIDEKDLATIQADPEVKSAVGVLVEPVYLDADRPFFLRIGMKPEDTEPFGVNLIAGRLYAADAPDELILGYRAARDLDKTIGDTIQFQDSVYTIVGIYSTGQVFGDAASMLPLVPLQAQLRKPGTITLAFVQVKDQSQIEAVRARIEAALPQLATIRTESDFGQVDRNLELLRAANTGVSALALVIGAANVLNMMSLSVFERTREFGVLRSVGWSRQRILVYVLSEAFMVTMAGAMVGVALGFLVVQFLQDVPTLRGVFTPSYSSVVFGRTLSITFGMAIIGALYPALRAALLRPLTAIRHE